MMTGSERDEPQPKAVLAAAWPFLLPIVCQWLTVVRWQGIQFISRLMTYLGRAGTIFCLGLVWPYFPLTGSCF